MKAKEYFEKYFNDLEKIEQSEFDNRIVNFFTDLTNEVKQLCKIRHSTSNSTVEGIMKEMDAKANAVNALIEKKHGKPLFKRNMFSQYWNIQFEKERQKLKEKNDG